ncbi:MAG: ATP-dependent DNA helicase [Chitinophagales bacterium]
MHSTTFNFTEEYNKLNSIQKLAVETTEGPVLVVAGPGTGKTQILAARIGNILDKGLAFAENILCLTYTEAGVTAMRKRLIQFIGAEAHKVNIHTFHSFCNKIIQDNPECFGFDEMEALSDLEEVELLEKLIDGFDKNHPLKRWAGSIYFESSRLKMLFSLMKRENFSAEKIENAIQTYLEDLPNREDFVYKRKYGNFKPGDLKIAKVDKEKESFVSTLAAIQEFKNYQELKKKANRYDFDDMIMDVMQKLQSDEWLLGKYQEQFHYFLVDEYQDTNGAQNEILRLLISYWEKPNVFVVGDDDQSIYRFQGANLENIIQFYSSNLAHLGLEEQQTRILVLQNNYRSSQEVLNLAASSIVNNQERLVNQITNLDLNKEFKAAGSLATPNQPKPRIVVYPNPSHETADIANQIIALKEQGVNLNEIAVLYKEHKYGEDLQLCLNQKNIPLSTSKKINVLQSRFTNMLLDILNYISEENRIAHSREDLLFNIMHFPFFEIKAIQIARLSFELRESRFSSPKTTWREALMQIQKIFDEESIKNIHALAELCNKWQKDLQEKPLQLLFQTILDDIHCIPYIQKQKERVWLLQELKTFFDFIKQENIKNPNLSLAEFLEIIAQLRKYEISVPYVRSSFAENAVQLSSIHGSKGLEYTYVFLIGCNSNLWEKKRPNNKGYKLPEGIMIQPNDEEKQEELRRLFFVAMTRAKKYLQISYSNEDAKERELSPSLFVTEISKEEHAEIIEKHLSDEEIFEYNVLQIMQEKIHPELIEKGLLQSLLENYSMSVTHLNNYLACPLKFYYHNFLRIPQAKNASLAFGSAIHDSLESFFKEMKERNQVFPSQDEFVEIAKKQMFKQQDSFTKKEYQQKLAYIEKFLPEYYQNYIDEWHKDVELEKKITAVYKNIKLNGKLDKIEQRGNKIYVIDYKTGKEKNRKAADFQGPSEKIKDPENPSYEEKFGGNYWRQAIFYKILLDNNTNAFHRNWELEKAEFDFVEPDPDTGQFKKREVLISPKDIEIVKDQISDTWNKIKELEFTGCGKADCSWCSGELEKIDEEN